MPSISLQAPAKLNLFLYITGRLPNGYHTLQSVVVLIDLCDTIELNLINDGVIRRTGDVIGQPENDLCVRAARLLQQKFSVPLGVEINVTKRIPAGAGMGGGSSDAASTLLGLNQLWGLKLSKDMTIGGLIRDGKGMLVDGHTQIMAGDHVLVFCLSGAIHKIEKIFN